jgi:hypothetical protein
MGRKAQVQRSPVFKNRNLLVQGQDFENKIATRTEKTIKCCAKQEEHRPES